MRRIRRAIGVLGPILSLLTALGASACRDTTEPSTELPVEFRRGFTPLAAPSGSICDDICYEPTAKPEFKTAAAFFRRYRDLTAGGFYTTPAGMKDIGYVGNVALPAYNGPPKEVMGLIERRGQL